MDNGKILEVTKNSGKLLTEGKKVRRLEDRQFNVNILPSLVGKNITNQSTRKAAFTKPSRGTNEVRDELLSTETLSFRCKSERCRLMRGAVGSCRTAAFTLAEVLITLAVIGIVAAMTMPVLINKVKDKQYDRAREKALMSIGEAGRLLAVQGDIGSASDAEDFVKNYLSKKLKIVKTCDSNSLEECGLPTTIKKLDGTTTMNMPKTRAELGLPSINNSTWKNNTTQYAFLTANGYAVNLFYNPNCTTDTNNDNSLASGYVCMNAIYDMNGLRNPNTVGKDIGFVTVLYPNETNRAVAPNPVPTASASSNWQTANNTCANMGKEYSLPDKDELMSMAINGNLIGITSGHYWSSSTRTGSPLQAWGHGFSSGYRSWGYKTTGYPVRCVRR